MHTLLIDWHDSNEALVQYTNEVVRNLVQHFQFQIRYQDSYWQSDCTQVHQWNLVNHCLIELRLVFDQEAQAIYLALDGDDLALIDQFLQFCTFQLPVVGVETLLEEISNYGGNNSQIYVRLALAASSIFSIKVYDKIKSALHSQQILERRGAALAAGLLLWPELVQPIQQALMIEQDSINQSLLTFALRQLSA